MVEITLILLKSSWIESFLISFTLYQHSSADIEGRLFPEQISISVSCRPAPSKANGNTSSNRQYVKHTKTFATIVQNNDSPSQHSFLHVDSRPHLSGKFSSGFFSSQYPGTRPTHLQQFSPSVFQYRARIEKDFSSGQRP